jgi:hypothetical protein
MMSRHVTCFANAVSGLLVAACAARLGAEPPPPSPVPSPPDPKAVARAEVARVVDASIGWAMTKDRPLLESVLAHDERLFIFHPGANDTVVGWDAFVPLFDIWMRPEFKATGYEVRDLRVDLSRSGEVAWFSAILDDCGEWQGKASCWKDTRWTGVVEKRDGRWVIVQMHFSFAAPSPKPRETPPPTVPR